MENMKVEDLLDLNFFEKCFFGKKLQIKDQLIFRIYAKELLEMIKSNLNKQIAKRQLQLLDHQNTKKRKKPVSKSSISKQYFYGSNQGNQHSNEELKKDNTLQIKEEVPSQQCLNITITKDPNDHINNDEYNVSVSQISEVFSPQIPNFSNLNLIVPNENIQPSTPTKKSQLFQNYFSKTEQVQRPFTPDVCKQKEESVAYNEPIRYAIPSYLEKKPSTGFLNVKKKDVTPTKNANQHLNHTIKIYQNLESQVKEILKKKDLILKQVRVKRKFESMSQRVSPNQSPKSYSKTQPKFSFQKQQSPINPYPIAKHFSETQSKSAESQQDNYKTIQDISEQFVNHCPSFSQIDPLTHQNSAGLNNLNSSIVKRSTSSSLQKYLNKRDNTPLDYQQQQFQNNAQISNAKCHNFYVSQIIMNLSQQSTNNQSQMKKINSKINDVNAIIAQGTIKNSAVEIIQSARKYIGKLGSIEGKNNSTQKKRYRSRPKELNNTIQQDNIEPFLKDFIKRDNRSPKKRSQRKIKNPRIQQLQTTQNSPTQQLFENSYQKVNDIRQFKQGRPILSMAVKEVEHLQKLQ